MGLLGASNGAMGGLRALSHLTPLLLNLHCWVCPKQFALGHAADAFDTDGRLKHEKNRAQVDAVVAQALWAARRLAG